MDDKKYNDNNGVDKYGTAIGLFYATGLFLGIGIFFILLFLIKLEWLISFIISLCIFLIFGFVAHAIISLTRKDG